MTPHPTGGAVENRGRWFSTARYLRSEAATAEATRAIVALHANAHDEVPGCVL